ncbi:MAG: hypothetical protein ACFFAZ_11135 [Promethearchaeota archaeon]
MTKRLIGSTNPKRDYDDYQRNCYWIDGFSSSLVLRSALPIAIM